MLFYQTLAYNIHRKIQKGSYSVSVIQDYFEYILKKTTEKRLITFQ